MSSTLIDTKDKVYPNLILGPSTIINKAKSLDTLNIALKLLDTLEKDHYNEFVSNFYLKGITQYGENWDYCDLISGLIAASSLCRPKKYLEIGVRRGRSVCCVALSSPEVEIWAFDMWIKDYAGMSNDGPKFVEKELKKVNYFKKVNFVNGNSHQTLPSFFSENPDILFDMITVDGDHSQKGALMDLRHVLPFLDVGGIIIFDDIIHPKHNYLKDVWNKAIREDGGILSKEYTELGYGLAIGVRYKKSNNKMKLSRLIRSKL
jgi:predicted O-methyltransferase YrrM